MLKAHLQPPKQRRSAELQSLSLKQWLGVEWFYPNDFKLQFVKETKTHFLVFGEKRVLKFYKFKPEDDSIKEGWQIAGSEIEDHINLSPTLYHGAYVLSWKDDLPQWKFYNIKSCLGSNRRLFQGEELVLVMERRAKKTLLSSKLSESQFRKEEIKDSLVDKLISFNEENRAFFSEQFRYQTSYYLSSLKKRYLDTIENFYQRYANYLDPFSRVSFLESKSFLKTYFLRNQEIFLQRGHSGLIIDCHGNLDATKVSYSRDIKNSPVQFFSRAKRGSVLRTGDVLQDLANLVIDLELRNSYKFARSLEKRYFEKKSEHYDQNLYRFLLVYSALQKTMSLFLREDDSGSLEQSLAIAFRYSIQLREPFLLVVEKNINSDANNLVQSLSELTKADCLSENEKRRSFQHFKELKSILYERLIRNSFQLLESGQSVLLELEKLNLEEEILLQKKCDKFSYKFALIKSEPKSLDAMSFEHPYETPSVVYSNAKLPLEERALSILYQLT